MRNGIFGEERKLLQQNDIAQKLPLKVAGSVMMTL
jgi:hypothetical protein